MAEEIETVEEAPEVSRDAKPWQDLIADAERYFKKWQTKSDSIDDLYANLEKLANEGKEREFQIFWANLEVLKPSIYSRSPVPVVTPRYKDGRDLPRAASELLERNLSTNFELEDLHAALILARDDLATNARGVVWLRYDMDDDREKVCVDHIDRGDFLCDPARKWKEVGWVARREWLTREKGLSRFGDAFLSAEFKERSDRKDEEYKGEPKAAVWEIWHRERRVVIWVTPGVGDVLDMQEPWLRLDGFFPCPRPAMGTTQRRTLIPVPDFIYYKDQIEEINELTARVSALAEALKMKGFYAAGAEDLGDALERLLSDNKNNATLVPVSNFAALGGASLKESIVWLPVVEVAQTITALVALRRQMIDDVYQITGLSDIMRGATDPNETLGAQELKSQYGAVRVRERQAEMVRLARDVTRIAAEIMAENFDGQSLLDAAQMDMPTQADIQAQIQQIMMQVQAAAQSPELAAMAQQNPQQAQQIKAQVEKQVQALQNTVTIDAVMAMLREQRVRPFVLDIETDSTIQPDENAEKQRRAEFLQAVGGFISQAGPMVMQMPQTGEFVAEALKFVAAPYRAGRQLEGAIDAFSQQIKDFAKQPKGPSPDEIKAKADAEARKADMDMKRVEHGARLEEMRMQMGMAQTEHELRMTEHRVKAASDLAKRAVGNAR